MAEEIINTEEIAKEEISFIRNTNDNKDYYFRDKVAREHISTLEEQGHHSHDNKRVLDTINSTTIANWNDAATNSHTHDNQEALNSIDQTIINNSHSHSNVDILDEITEDNIHSHTNKAVLDGIDQDVIDGWNSNFETINTLVNGDTGKSIRQIANDELAAQLIPQTAQEAFDTLQEISAWIQSHPGDAAAMNQDISDIKGEIGQKYKAEEGSTPAQPATGMYKYIADNYSNKNINIPNITKAVGNLAVNPNGFSGTIEDLLMTILCQVINGTATCNPSVNLKLKVKVNDGNEKTVEDLNEEVGTKVQITEFVYENNNGSVSAGSGTFLDSNGAVKSINVTWKDETEPSNDLEEPAYITADTKEYTYKRKYIIDKTTAESTYLGTNIKTFVLDDDNNKITVYSKLQAQCDSEQERSNKATISSYRNVFYGFSNVDNPTINSEFIRALQNSIKTTEIPTSEDSDLMEFTIEGGSTKVLVAFPSALISKTPVFKTYVAGQWTFTASSHYSTIEVFGANSQSPVDYKIYTINQAGAYNNDTLCRIYFN